jgi:hypothetical protein
MNPHLCKKRKGGATRRAWTTTSQTRNAGCITDEIEHSTEAQKTMLARMPVTKGAGASLLNPVRGSFGGAQRFKAAEF